MIVEALTDKQEKYLKQHRLSKKYLKQISTLVINPNYPGLNLEKLVPNSMGLYSFRLDIHYRVVFRYVNEHIKIISITNHYH